MKYTLADPAGKDGKQASALAAVRRLWPLVSEEKATIVGALLAIFINGGLNLVAPLLMGIAIDTYVQAGDFGGLLWMAALLLVLYLISMVAAYMQTTLFGGVGQRLLYRLRNAVFEKLQELPVAFFNQNKAGDLISRINNDTDKLNQFFSQSLMQFIGSFFMVIGAAIFLLTINIRLGAAALLPAVMLLIVTQGLGSWIRRKNAASLQALGGMSAEIQESLNNFKVVVAFNRRDYFRERFREANEQSYVTSVRAGVANTVFIPLYALCSNVAQLIVLGYGVYLIAAGDFTVGLLISYFTFVTRFYDPLRQIAAIWAAFQAAMAGWDRISAILSLQSDLPVLPAVSPVSGAPKLAFRGVHFGYPDGKEVLHGIDLELEKGKTYALVGPTGGGKTTTASLMVRLYDPTEGQVLLDGRDIRTYEPAERVRKIGMILQEPFLFSGTVRDNILYGNAEYASFTNEQLAAEIEQAQLGALLARFENGLDTKVVSAGDSISLGQKQLIAFMRAVLRRPEILVLDEATANIDTVTEQLLEGILQKLPPETTKVIIAHRLNTIESADGIYFVNAGDVVPAGSLDHAVEMLLHHKRES